MPKKKKSSDEQQRRFFGCRISQRKSKSAVKYFVFFAPVKDIATWAGVRRVTEKNAAGQVGTQRVLREPRVNAIRRFMESDPANSIPNNILLAFEKGSARFRPLHGAEPDVDTTNGCEGRVEWGTIEFSFDPSLPEAERAVHIVDGQHRVYGMSKLEKEEIPVLVVGLLDASVEEEAFQFIVINNKAVRAPTENVKSIIAGIDEQKLSKRLLNAGVPYGGTAPWLRDLNTLSDSPFRSMLDWAHNPQETRLIPLTAVEQAMRYLRSSLAAIDDDEDSLSQVFMTIWRAVRDRYRAIWGMRELDSGETNPLMSKVGISALNEFLTDKVKSAWEFEQFDIFVLEEVYDGVDKFLSAIPEAFWTSSWSVKIQDNSNIRAMIKSDLDAMLANRRLGKSWRSELRLLKQRVTAELD